MDLMLKALFELLVIMDFMLKALFELLVIMDFMLKGIILAASYYGLDA